MSKILASVPAQLTVSFQTKHREEIVAQCPSAMAGEWLEVILTAGVGWHDIIAEMLTVDDAIAVADLVSSGDIPFDAVSAAGKNLLAAAAGRPWWETFNLLAVAEEAWDVVGGELALRGVRPQQVTIGQWLDAAWMVIQRSVPDERDRDRIAAAIRSRPGSSTDGDGSMDVDDFMAAARGSVPGLSG